MSTIRPHIPRTNSVESYITIDLKYCCTYLFFELYPGPKWTRLVADRLGVTTRAVRYCREAATECPNAKGCKRSHLSAAKPDKPPQEKG